MRKSIITVTLLFFITFLLTQFTSSCKKVLSIPGVHLLTPEQPDNFPPPLYNFANNPLSEEGFQLGRKLFYDTRLSADTEVSCGTCHQQIAAFGTYNHDLSHGVHHSHTERNAPVLFNLNWYPSFHWDGRFDNLQDEAVQPITGVLEMGETFQRIKNKIKDDPEYQRLFKQVFNTSEIQPIYILRALEQFTGSLISSDSKYDQYKKGLATFTTQEADGYVVFTTHCAGCHKEPLFTDNSYRNIGLPKNNHLNDNGRMSVTGLSSDSLKFKVPTLRNCYKSNNYMHDGRFGTLQQVIQHYRFGVQQSPTLDPALTNGIQMTNTEADDLFKFLQTLTDFSFLNNPRFAKPD